MICGVCGKDGKYSLLKAGPGGASFKMVECGHKVIYRQAEGTFWYNDKK